MGKGVHVNERKWKGKEGNISGEGKWRLGELVVKELC